MNKLQSMFWGLAITAISLFASCSDDDIVAEITLPAEIEQAQMQGLESHSYSIPFEVKSDSEWKIEFDEAGEEIAYVSPSSGKGNATIKLYVLDNLSKEQRQGTMTIVFPEDTGKNKVVTLKQKAQGASDDNFSEKAVGNIAYGVGYGFNVVTGIGPRGLKAQIIKAEKLMDEKLVQRAATSATTAEVKTYSGSTIKDLSNNFSTEFSLDASGFGIEAEANTKFNMNHYSKDEYQYAMSFVDVSKEQITITLSEDEWAYYKDEDGGCYTMAAYKAINGEHRKYPSTNAGFKALFDSYGTHVVRTATLGGRLTIATTVNTSEVKAEYDLTAFAKLSYSGVIEVGGEVNEEFKSSFNSSSNACQTKITALGGSSSIFNDLSDLVGDGAKNAANAWFTSLNEDESTWTFIGLDDMNNLIPLWDLVEEEGRAKQMQEYFESGQYAKEVTSGVTYDLGVQAQLTELPEFELYGTQIADIKVGDDQNKTVARVCNEFIPELDEKAPVKVFYPVVNGIVKWSMGWFPGNSYLSPRRVVNANGKIKVEAITTETELGEASEIYIRGVHISSQSLDEEIPVQEASSAMYYDKLHRGNIMSDYKVVKILDKIWLAENYAATVLNNANPPGLDTYAQTLKYESLIEGINDWCYYSQDFLRQGYYSDRDFKTKYLGQWNDIFRTRGSEGYDLMNHIIETLLKPHNLNVAEAFGLGGCLRFNAAPSGEVLGNPVWGDASLGEDIVVIKPLVKDGTENRFYLMFTGDMKEGKDTNNDCFYIDFKTGAYGKQNVKAWKSNTSNGKDLRILTPIRLYRPLD